MSNLVNIINVTNLSPLETQIIKLKTDRPVINPTAGTILHLFSSIRNSGIIFSCGFVKKTNGEYRVMNCRASVKVNQKGVGLKFKPIEKHLLSVWDCHKKEYRFINLDSLIWLKFRKQVYVF